MDAIRERDEARAYQEALGWGLIAAEIRNANRGRGSRVWRPTDFVRAPRRGSAGSRAPTAEEAAHLEHRMGPTRSIRDG